MLEEEQFLNIVKYAPLVAIDLAVKSPDNGLLMGLRENQPAAGYWFVPGGRIRKNETLEAAFLRITKAELGKPIGIENARLMGAFTHQYDTNFSGQAETGTHYVVLAYELQMPVDLADLPNEQHSEYRWIHEDEALEQVHENSTAYFSYLSNRQA